MRGLSKEKNGLILRDLERKRREEREREEMIMIGHFEM